jgi:hypothetical protein
MQQRMPSFDPRSVHLGYAVNKVALGQISLRLPLFYPGSIIDILTYLLNCNWVATWWQQYSTHLSTNNTQKDTKQTIHRTTPKFLEECGPCPDYASYTLAFVLQLRKTHAKTSVRVAEGCQLAQAEECQLAVLYTYVSFICHNCYTEWK